MFHRVDEHVACLLYGPLNLLWTKMPSGVSICFWPISITQRSFCLQQYFTFYFFLFSFFPAFLSASTPGKFRGVTCTYA